ncbi:MAG TPA: CarD family transcriptional regulator, partial [Planctomycetota bacterium]|nr:CarD family transcriptional regulator [Planctomycetota bacterium]
MKRFAEALAADPRFAAALPQESSASAIGGVVGAAAALAVAAVRLRRCGAIVVVLPDPEDAERFAGDLEHFGAEAALFPPRGTQPDRLRLRLEAMEAARGGGDPLLVAPIAALLEPVPDRARVRESVLSLAVNERVSLPELVRRLVGGGFERVPLVAKPGELSLRGDLFDFWPFSADAPIRVEAFDDAIESIRRFDAATQRSIERLERVAVPLVRDAETGGPDPIDEIPADALVVEVEPARIGERGEGLAIQGESLRDAWGRFRARVAKRARLELRALPGAALDLGCRTVREMGVGIRASHDVLSAVAKESDVVVFCATEGEASRLREILRDRGVDASLPIDVRVGELSRGFLLPRVRLTALTHAELVGAIAIRRPARARKTLPTRAIDAASELHPGDRVVHAVHGVGVFRGIERLQKGDGEEDHLALVFADDAVLYVPASRIDLVAKYVGAGGAPPALDKIGGAAFARRKAQVRRAVADLAAELLEVQAVRQLRTGFACPSDDELQREFEAAFPWQDTDDQVSVNAEIKRDLESPRPMDRLLCGDVGYGKTELAMRAAFKVVRAGRQVAVLVPTTVLAQQHFHTFSDRFAVFPARVELLSRFRS